MRMFARILRGAVWAAVACAAATAGAVSRGGSGDDEVTEFNKAGITVTDSTLSPVNWSHGTTLHTFLIENHRPERRTMRLAFRWASWGEDSGGMLSGTVTVEGGGKSRIMLPQPCCQFVREAWTLETAGFDDLHGVSRTTQGNHSSNSEQEPAFLLSRSFSAEKFTDALSNAVAGAHSPARTTSHYSSTSGTEAYLRPVRCLRDPAVWTADWRAYSPFDACLVTAAEWATMPAEARNALKNYVAMGGMLVVADATRKLPAEFTDGLSARGFPGSDNPVRPYGLGRVMTVPGTEVAAWPEALRLDIYTGAAALRNLMDPGKLNDYSSGLARFTFPRTEIPMTAGTNVHMGVFFLVLFVFAVLAGPVCVYVLARTNHRIWLFAVVPAFSFVVGAAIFAVLLALEGVTPHERRQALTILDQAARTALTRGEIGIYAPAAVGTLRFDADTEVQPLPYVELPAHDIDIGDGQLYTGWTPPRMAAFFRLRRAETRSERLVVTELPDNRAEVVNALGAPITELKLGDGRGNVYRARDLAAGERRTLTPAAPDPKAGSWDGFQAAMGMPGGGTVPKYTTAKAAFERFAVPGRRRYAARLAGCPFLERPLGRRSVHEDAESIVLGSF